MDIGFRVFFLEEDGNLRNVPWQTYVGLYSGFPSVRFPEYSGKAVKCVHVVVELEDRAPVAILESVFFITHFDEDGRIDREKKVERQRIAGEPEALAGQAVPSGKGAPAGRPGTKGPRVAGHERKRVIDLLPRLAGKRRGTPSRWALTVEETENLERRVEELLNI